MGSYDDDGYPSRTMAIGGRLMMEAIVAVFTVVFYFLLKRIYARCFSGRSGSLRRHRLAFVGQHDPPRLQNVGLGKSAIEALPVFAYQLERHKDGLQCAVCLCEFEDNEKGRLLPKCHHSFHIDCIDMWFRSHSTCPLCRASAQADAPADSVVVPLGEAPLESTSETEQEVSPVPEGSASISGEPDSDIDLCHSCTHDEVLPSPTYPWATQKAVSSVSNSAFFEQGTTSTSGKTLDKTVIDIPRQVDTFSSPRLFSGHNQQVFSPSDRSNSPVFVSVN